MRIASIVVPAAIQPGNAVNTGSGDAAEDAMLDRDKAEDSRNVKAAAQQAVCGTETVQGLGMRRAPSTMREQAEQQVGYHRTQAEKHDAAAAFFRENPAFDEFVRLVRSGAIQF